MASSARRHELPETAERCMHALWRLANEVGAFLQGPSIHSIPPRRCYFPGGRFSAWPVSLRCGGATTQWALIPWPDYDETVHFRSFILCAKGIGLALGVFEAVVIKGRFQHLFLSSRDHAREPRTVNKDGKIRRGGNWWDSVFTRAIQYKLEDCM